jgi:hypothetical protein
VQTSWESSVDDYDAIREVVQLCLDGEAKGDVAKLQQAFHQDARMFGDLAGTRYDVPIQTLFDMAAQGPADTGSYQSRIPSITHLGDVATTTVAEEELLGDGVLRRLLQSLPHQGHLEDSQQDLHPCRRRAARLGLPWKFERVSPSRVVGCRGGRSAGYADDRTELRAANWRQGFEA